MSDLKERLKEYEGTLAYQRQRGYYRNGKFFPYKDSLNKLTVGYGHLVLPCENFSNGITENEADTLLAKDLANVVLQVQTLKLNLPPDWNDFIIIMTFQLGFNGIQKFKKMIAALKVKDWKEAIHQARDSLWYVQTPNRINSMINELKNK